MNCFALAGIALGQLYVPLRTRDHLLIPSCLVMLRRQCPSFTLAVAHSFEILCAAHSFGHSSLYCAKTRQSPPVSGYTDRVTHKILNRDPKDEILKAFRLFDDDETGKISFKNLKRVAKELGERMTDEELQEMIDEADRDGDGEVNEEEFLRIMKKTNLF